MLAQIDSPASSARTDFRLQEGGLQTVWSQPIVRTPHHATRSASPNDSDAGLDLVRGGGTEVTAVAWFCL